MTDTTDVISGGGEGGEIRRLVRAHGEPHDVTVVIPAYQRADLVGRAVLSALAQRPRPAADVVVVDDGSTDGTGEVAGALGATVLRQPNAGEGAARNAGLRAARTRWVALLDSDDEWLPGHLAALMPHTPGAVLVAGIARGVPSGRLAGSPARAVQRIGPREVVWPQSPFAPSAVVLDRDRTLAVGGFPELRLGADLDLWLRLLETGPGVVVPEVTCVYAEHAGQVSGDPAQMRRARHQVVARHAAAAWFDPALPARMDAVDRWDEFRQGGPTGVGGSGRALAAVLADGPRAWAAVAQTVRWRLAGRFR